MSLLTLFSNALLDDAWGVRSLGHEMNEDMRKPIVTYCERIVRILSRTKQNAVTVDRNNHHYKLEIHRDNGGNIVSIDVLRNHGMKLTFSIICDGNICAVRSCAMDPFKYFRLYTRIRRIADELERA